MSPIQSIKPDGLWKAMSLTPVKDMHHACDNQISIFLRCKLDYLLTIIINNDDNETCDTNNETYQR